MTLATLLLASCSHEKRVKVGVSQCSYDDWRLKLNEEMQRENLLHENLDLEIRSAYDDPARQVEDIRHFINEGVDVIVTSPQNDTNLNQVLAEARSKGIKIIDFDRLPSTECYDIYVGADNENLGHAAAKYLIERLPEGAHFIEIMGSKGSTPAGERSRGFRKALAESGKMVLLDTARADWTTPQAERAVDSLLRLHPEVDAIFAHNDRMAIGAARAARKAGLQQVMVAGIDAVPETGIKAVADGEIDVTFTYPTAGKELIELAMKAAAGKEVSDEFILSSLQPVDKSNAKILLELSESINDEKSKITFLQDRINHFSSIHTLQRTLLIGAIALAVLLAGLLFFIMQAYRQRRRAQAALAERNQLLSNQRDELESLNKRLQEATQSKLRFFTNVSHDLRTPLTLISEPLATIGEAGNLTPRQQTMLQLAEKNVLILRRLINQILDFRKFEDSRLHLSLTEGDMRRSLLSWSEAFLPLARRHYITYKVNIDLPQPTEMAFDAEKMERIFFNIMGNAFKYTPDNGKISVNASTDGKSLTFSISNTGKGIKKEDLGHIFERFYQAHQITPQGSGIGLALVKAFTELHQGTVSVTSEPDRETIFTVSIPVSHTDKRSDADLATDRQRSINTEFAEILESTVQAASPVAKNIVPAGTPGDTPDTPAATGEEESAQPQDSDKRTLLIIDDTRDMRTLLRSLLEDEYNIIEAADGKQGIRLASKYSPDLIICDMMMPEMDGMECCRRIKEEISTSHIPVLMLTACKLDEQRADAYEAGADGFISKPFNNNVLRARCHSLLSNRMRLNQNQIMPRKNKSNAAGSAPSAPRMHATDKSTAATTSKTAKTHAADPMALENEFYRKFIEIVDEELSNADISVEEIGSRLGLSRVQFYRKIKAITNFSPVELIRIRRLNEAYRLLTSTEKTVSEIAYSTGFSNPGYFTKCFKEQFGELPADLQKRTSKLK